MKTRDNVEEMLSYATPSGTKRFHDRMKSNGGLASRLAPAKLGSTGLWVSRLGFGAYRVHEHEPDHREALLQALQSGVNLIDTSANYTDGSSERLIGLALQDLLQGQSEFQRDELVIVSKAGFIQGTLLAQAKAAQKSGAELWPDLVEVSSEVWHCISPAFLEVSLEHTLQRLKLDRLDVLLIHNPETFFKASRKNIDERKAFYKRLQNAFAYLESQRQAGRIRWYGVSSNGLPEPENQSSHVSLAKLLAAAEAVGGADHGFRVIEFPMNILEAQPLLFRQQEGKTLLEMAAEHDLGVLTNRPLNARREGRVQRLAYFTEHNGVEIKGELHSTLGQVLELERQLPIRTKPVPIGLRWGHELREPIAELGDVLSWREFALVKIYPSIRQAMNRLPQDAAAQAWRSRYEHAISRYLDLITADLEVMANSKAQVFMEQIDGLAPELRAAESLALKSIEALLGVTEVHSVLVGMRRPRYVKDVLRAKGLLTPEKAQEFIQSLQRHRS